MKMERELIGDKTFGPDEMWTSEPISILHFPFRSHFQKLISDISRILVQYTNIDPYNSVTSFVRFYEEFKKQDLDLMTFYETGHKPTVQEDSQNCIGKALYLRRMLLKLVPANEHPNLENYVYIATCNTYLSNQIPTRYHKEFPRSTACYVTHCCLVLKFTLESEKRRGFLILDSGYMIDFPVVVMEDGKAPDTGRFQMMSKKGGKSCQFTFFNENYVYWLIETPKDSKSSDNSVEYRWIFLGKKLQNLLQIEKRNRLNTFHALAFGDLGGVVVSLYSVLGTKDHVEVSVQDPTGSAENQEPKFLTYRIPFAYFLAEEGHPRVTEWETALTLFDERFRRFDNLRELLRRFVVLATDTQFVKELATINDSWRAIIEPIFNS